MTSAPNWDSILNFAQTHTDAVGQHIALESGQVAPDEKSDGSLVTRCDRWSDDYLRHAITENFPDHGILSEEVSHIFPENEWCWVIDPIDGTTNFTRGIPLWAISLGLLYHGTPVFGYIYLPNLGDQLSGFWQAPGHTDGAFLNGQPINTRTDAPANNQCFSLCARSLKILQKPFPCKIRMLGVASYNLLSVATGSLIGAVEATPKIWDIAGAWPIVQAAGGSWVTLDQADLFPLKPGENYGDRNYPSLALSQAQWLETFIPLVNVIIAE